MRIRKMSLNRCTIVASVVSLLGLAGAASAQEGACCFSTPTGGVACSVTTADRCAQFGGTYAGDGTVCDDTTCAPAPTGACCVASVFGSDCYELTEAACDYVGTYQGDGTTCDTATCGIVGMCPCDYDMDGALTVMDLLGFLRAYFDGNADFNGDMVTDVMDVLDFINCFFGGDCFA